MHELHSFPVTFQQHFETPLLAKGSTWGIIFIVALILTPILINLFATREVNETYQETTIKEEKTKEKEPIQTQVEQRNENYINGFLTEKTPKTHKKKKIDNNEEFPTWTTGYFYNNNNKNNLNL
jgi:hypothetical protein